MSNIELKFGPKVADKMYIRKIVDRMGFCPKYKGYYYIIFIVGMLLHGRIKSFSREVYPLVSTEFGVGAATIERDIRHFIKTNMDDVAKNCLELNDVSIRCRMFLRKLTGYVSKHI